MFTDENTKGYSETCLKYMNQELEEALKDFEYGTPKYWEEEKRASEEILKKWDEKMCEVADFFFC
jgi:hypothetical protein